MAYLIALYVTAIVGVYALVGMNQSISDIKIAQLLTDVNQAFHMAESGVVEAISEFMVGGDDSITNFSLAEGWSQNGDTVTTCTSGQDCEKTVVLVGNSVVIIVDDIRASEPTITANGTAKSFTQTVEAIIERPAQAYFQWPLYGVDEVWVKQGGYVDSYDSRLGAYGAVLDTADDNYGTLNQSDAMRETSLNANVRTESVQQDMLTLATGTTVYGDAVVGVGGVPSVVINADPISILGSQEAATSSVTLPAVVLPSGSPSGTPYSTTSNDTVDLGSCGCSSISVQNGATLILTGDGELHLTSVTIGTNSTLQVDGSQVTLVVDSLESEQDAAMVSNATKLEIYGTGVGTVDFRKSNIQNNNQNPASLRLSLKGTNPLTVKKDISFYGTIYAPEATVSIDKNAAVFGSVLAKRIVIQKDAAIHYDDALEDVEDKSSDPVVFRSWRQP